MGDQRGLVLLPTLKGPARGLRFALDLQTRIESAYFYGSYDLAITRRLGKICQKGWTIWDCGIYLGYYTCLFARLVGPTGQVVGFEPDPRNLLRAKENSKINGFSNIKYVQVAIGGTSGEIDFILSDNTNSHIPGVYVGSTVKDYQKIERQDFFTRVRCMTLDEAYLQKDIPHPDLIKIDIEGAEKEALQQIQRLTCEKKPLIVLELHNPECDAAAWEFAQRVGYALRSLETGHTITKASDVRGTLLCSPQK